MITPYLLDLDGTLMPSHEVDNRCYWAAVGETFSREVDTLALDGFTQVTDSALLEAWCQRELGRAPTPAEVGAVRSRFLALLQAAAEADPGPFTPHPGVAEWLAARPPGSVGIATGGWGHTARFKLQHAGLLQAGETAEERTDASTSPRRPLPLASADDAKRRVDIMRIALGRLGREHRSSRPVFLGDSPWDVAAARELGWPFIGVASGRRAEGLRAAGATRVIDDFLALAA